MNDLRPFRFWCQKVLPLVYDDELSYYELLCKVVDYLNKTIENVNNLSENFDELQSAFNTLKDYVDNYFKNLDVQEEINNKLDVMAETGFFNDIFSRFGLFYVTPQMYGAKGDGVHDDTEAINKALKTSKFVVIPSGTYLVSDTIKLLTGNRVTVLCATKSIIKATKTLNPVVDFGTYVGWEEGYFSWTGGTIDCGNFANCVGVRFERRSTGTHVDNIVVQNIGSNGVGIGICDNDIANYHSIQLNLGRIRINAFPDTGVYEPNKFTTGMVIKAYDMEISSLYILGTTVGLNVEVGTLIHINDYHYWIGASNDTPLTVDNYLKTRGLICNGNVIFDLLYIDMPYVMTSGSGSLSASNSYFIGIKKGYVSTNDNIIGYIHEFNGIYSDINYGTTTISYNDCELHSFLNTANISDVRYVNNNVITCEYAYTTEAYLKPTLIYNFCNSNKEHTFIRTSMTGNTNYVLGYVPKIPGQYKINITSHNNSLQASFKVWVTTYSCVIDNLFSAVDNVDGCTVGVGDIENIDGFDFYPIIISIGKTKGGTFYMNTTGIGGFYLCEADKVYNGTVSRAITNFGIKDVIYGVPCNKDGLTIPKGKSQIELAPIYGEINSQLTDTGLVSLSTSIGANKIQIQGYNKATHTLTVISDLEYTNVSLYGLVYFTIRTSL